MRIVGGRFRGHPIAAPRSADIRPTSDKTREAVFNILAHGAHPVAWDEIAVLDLFAGTGALGFEALSRGARSCLFVDTGAEARGLIRRTIEALGLEREAKVFRRDAAALGEAGSLGPFHLAFADPPYSQGLGERALAAAARGGWLAPGALVVLEEAAGAEVAWPAPFAVYDRREYGAAAVAFARFAP
ncbi:MAG: 16S rRNA (guanine(966)-N(2))-methyltransferase RsmD [Hyphomicrobiales bacterium]|nr:16S rRNA (guanine(966)-N(2))-methyltransferase RsmD [Hyphomicrobiales bacterium]